MINALLTFLGNATVKTFFAEYLATKGLDITIDKVSSYANSVIHGKPEKQLIEVVSTSIKNTCQKYHWDYQYIMTHNFAKGVIDQNLITETDLSFFLATVFGYDVSSQISSFWISEFFSILSEKQYQEAKNYFDLFSSNKLLNSTSVIQQSVDIINESINNQQNLSKQAVHGIQEMSSLLKNFELSIKTDYQLIERLPVSFEYFIDRNDELTDTFDCLTRHTCILIGGMRGIGKTAFVQKYILTYKEHYDCIVYIKNIPSIKDMIIDDLSITIRNLTRRILNNQKESNEEYYNRKLKILTELVTPKVLFVLDGIQLNDPALTEFISIGAKYLLITNDNVLDVPMPHKNIDSFCEEKDLLSLFMQYYVRNDIDRHDTYLWKMFDKCMGHTLTVKLLALQMKANHKSPQKMYQLLEEKGLGRSMSDSIYYFDNGYEQYQAAFDFIRPLFRVDLLEDCAILLLEFLTLFKDEEVFVNDIEQWLGSDGIRITINYLHHHGWLIYDEYSDMICLHSIIREVVLFERNVSMDMFSDALNRVLYRYSDFSLNLLPLSKRVYYGRIIKALVSNSFTFEKLLPFVFKAERALSYAQLTNESIDLANKINNWISINTPHDYYSLGRIIYCLGWTYSTQLRDKETGIKLMEKGLSIILKLQRPFSTETIRLLSDVYGDIALVRARISDSDKTLAIQESLTAVDYFKELFEDNESYYARLSWLEIFVAECYIKNSDFDAAIFWIEEAMQHVLIGPGENSPYYMNILYRKAQLSEKKKDYIDALRNAIVFQTEYLKYHPYVSTANLEHLLFISQLFYNNGDTSEAIEYINSAIKIVNIIYGEQSPQTKKYTMLLKQYEKARKEGNLKNV